MGPGENIAAFRHDKGLTQEELGRLVGVTMQAVSKWENGGAPDTALLPGIADALGVSIDALFGRVPTVANVEQAIAREIAALPREARMRRAFALCWALERSLITSGDQREDEGAEESIKGRGFTQAVFEQGMTLMKLYPDSQYFFLAPEPEAGYRKLLLDPEAQTKFLAFLGQRDVYDALALLYTRDESPFTAKYVERRTGIPVARASEIMAAFAEYRLVDIREIELDDERLKVYTASANPALIPFLAFLNELIKRPSSFFYQSCHRKKPYFREVAQ